MVVVLPEPLTPTTRMTNGLRGHFQRLGHRRQHLLDLGGEQRLHLVGRDGLLVAAFAERAAMRPANSGPRSARISSSSSSSSVAASSLRLVTRSVIAPPSDAEVRLSPPLRRFHQLLLGAVVHVSWPPVIAVSASEHDTGRDARPPALPRRADAGDRQAGRLCRASRAEGRRRAWRTISTRCASACRAIRRWRTGSTRTPPAAWCSAATARRWRCSASCSSRARSARPIGRWSKAGPRPTKAASTFALGKLDESARLVDEAGPARAAGGNDLEGDGARAPRRSPGSRWSR